LRRLSAILFKAKVISGSIGASSSDLVTSTTIRANRLPMSRARVTIIRPDRERKDWLKPDRNPADAGFNKR
jgi:hypothetical protein